MPDATEHVQWAKDRALAELESGGPHAIATAMASVASDLRKHPDTEGHPAIELMMMLALGGHMRTGAEVRDFIEGIR